MSQLQNRVKYPSRPGSLPDPNTDLDKLNQNDIRALRSVVDAGIQSGQISDNEMLSFIDLQSRAADRLQVLEAREAYIAQAAKQAPAIVRSVGDSHGSLASSFSISRAILTAHEGRQQSGAEAEVIAEGRRNNPHARGQIVIPSFVMKRDLYGNTVAGAVDAAVTGKQTMSSPLLTALHGEPVLQGLGATIVNATGSATFLVPYLSRTAAASTGEGTSATSTAGFNELSLTPTRYSRRVDVTQLALRSNGSAIDQVLLQDFQAAHSWAQDAAGFAAIKASATFTPATETGTDDLAATTIGNLMDLCSDIQAATRESATPTLVCSPIGFEVLNAVVATNLNQTLAQVYRASAGGNVIAAVGMIDGDIPAEKALASVAADRKIVGAGLVAGGYFPDLVVARWGDGVDLVVDPYTDSDSGVIRVIGNSYSAAGIVRDSFRCLAVASSTITDVAD
jgi:HK97 family phage major capsid protein